jgi:hypothetical protein
VLATIPNIERLMTVRPGLYETLGAPPTFAQVRTPGGIAWSKRVSSLFGGAAYDPSNGWIIEQYGRYNVGSVGSSSGRVIDLAKSETIGFAVATGKVIWRAVGEFECGGGVLPGRFLCLMTGTASPTATGGVKVSRDASAALEGFEPTSGKITWRLPVRDTANLLLGNMAIRDSSHLLVTSRAGKPLIVDLASGAISTPARGAAFWCQRLNLFKIKPAKGLMPERVGTSRFFSCDAGGRATGAAAKPSSGVGVTVGHVFVWAAPSGLEAMRVTA